VLDCDPLYQCLNFSGDIELSGDQTKLRELFGLFDEFSTGFEIVELRKVKVE
jgi:alkyl sulfatase BDS1-like metallo-beta-lactamase superfamily hydrolase